MQIVDLKHSEGRVYPARRRTQNLVGGISPIQATAFSIGYVTLEPNGGQVPWHNQEQEKKRLHCLMARFHSMPTHHKADDISTSFVFLLLRKIRRQVRR